MNNPIDLIEPIGATDHVLGAPHAQVEVVEYGDFQCPTCKVAVPAVQMEAARRSHLRATPGFFVDRRILDVSFGNQALFDATEAALTRRKRSGAFG